jgi:GH25 family lysozyme M1 (1,4-beta-N-acetylmuramidase)
MIGTKERAYGVDVSRYESDFNPDNAIPGLIDFGITKATEGINYVDPYFEQLYIQISKLSVNGTYHYIRSGISGIDQAKFFLNTIAGKSFDILAIDFERIGNVMSDSFVKILYDCINYIYYAKPECKVILYTNPDLYDTIIYPASIRLWGKDVFTTWDLWIAQYYYVVNPDGEPYIKNRKDWKIWQFSAAGTPAEHGTSSYVDIDVFNGTKTQMFAWLNKTTITTYPYTGVTQKQGLLNNQKYYLQTIDPYGKQIKVKHFSGTLKQVQSAAQSDNAQIAVNGDDYIKGGVYLPRGMSYTDGRQYTPEFEFRYWLNVSKNNTITYGFGKPPTDAYNLTSFIRPLVVDGKLHPSVTETNIVNTEIHARSIIGINAQGQLMILVCEGFVNPDTGVAYAGVTIPQAAQLMLDSGATFAGEHGGGGDAGLYSQDKMQNESSDRDAGIGWRGVVQAIEIFTGETMGDYYKIIGNDGNNHTVRLSYDVRSVPIYYPGTINRVTITNTIGGECGITDQDIFIYQADVLDSNLAGGYAAKKGDIWRKVYKVGNTFVSGYTAEVHLGVKQGVTLTLVSTTPPPPSISPVVFTSQNIDFTTKIMTITRKRQDGTTDVSNDPIA